MQNSTGDISHLRVTFANGFELDSVIVFHRPIEFLLKVLRALLTYRVPRIPVSMFAALRHRPSFN